MPMRLMLKEEDAKSMLKCHGFGMIRAISLERQLFYVITPVDQQKLKSITVFALGHNVADTQILFETKVMAA